MKWIIVSGDSGGLGSKIAEVLLEDEQYGVIGISRSENERTAELKEKSQTRYRHIQYDLSDPEGIKELYTSFIRPIGPIFGLVNNSAFAYDDIVTNANPELLIRMLHVNVASPVMLTKYAIRDMVLHGTKGSIVHISSVSAHTGFKGLSMYASTKGALESFSKGVAREWGHRGIRSNCVTPGFMETAMSGTLSDEQRNKIYRRNCLPGATDIGSVAHSVAYLLSEKAASITGTIIQVDNGTI